MRAIQVERDGSTKVVDVKNQPTYNVPICRHVDTLAGEDSRAQSVEYAHYIRRGIMFDNETRIFCREGIVLRKFEGDVLHLPDDGEAVPKMWNEMRGIVARSHRWHVIVDESDTPCEAHDDKVREAVAARKIVKRKLRMLIAIADPTRYNA